MTEIKHPRPNTPVVQEKRAMAQAPAELVALLRQSDHTTVLSSAAKMPILEYLALLDVDQQTAILHDLPKRVQEQLFQALQTERAKLEDELADVDYQLRDLRAQYDAAMFQYERLLAVLKWLGQQFQSAFQTMFAQPEAALRQAWTHQATHGLDQTSTLLKQQPGKFGELKSLSGKPEKMAPQDFDFAEFFTAYSEASRMQQELEQRLAEVNNVTQH